MRQTTSRSWRFAVALLLAATGFAAALAYADAAAPAIPATPVTPAAAATPGAAPVAGADLPHLADAGQFDQLLASLRADKSVLADAQVAALVRDLEAQAQHHAAATAKRREAYQKAYDKMVKAIDENHLDESIGAGVEAHGLADDSNAMLKEERLAGLIQKAQDAALAAEKESDWLEALNLFRLLDLFYEDLPRFRIQARECERHVRVLRLYAPAELQRLYDARAKRQGKEKADPLNLGDETWEKTLEGVEMSMLRTTLSRAAQRHVSNTTYNNLLMGSLDALLVLADTPSAAASFPGLKDAAKLKTFREELVTLRKNLAARKDPLNYLDAITTIDKVMQVNRDTLEFPEAVMVFEMGDGATSTLDDYSNIIWPHEKEEFSRMTQGKFGGVGIQISRRDNRLIVVSPLEDTPAQKAGIKPQDIIVSVDGKSTAGWTLDQAVRTITGPEGTPVTLGIERAGQTTPLTFKLERAEIVIESIKGWQHKVGGGWDYLIDPAQKIGYVRLSQFIPQSAEGLDAAVNQLEQAGGLNALVLDLRFNPGGLLSSAIEISNRFVKDGVIVSTVGADGKTASEARARPEKTYAPFPVVVLVNDGSASASEIVSGCLQDHGRATIIGTRSFGKGSVQDIFSIDNDKASLKLTTQYYRLPNGRILHRKPDSKTWGVEPDLIVKMTAQQIIDWMEVRQDADILRDGTEAPTTRPAATADQILTKGLDPQLEAALLVLKTRLVAQHIAVAQKDQPALTPTR